MPSSDILRFMFVNPFPVKGAGELDRASIQVQLSESDITQKFAELKQKKQTDQMISLASDLILKNQVFTTTASLHQSFPDETNLLSGINGKTITTDIILSENKQFKINQTDSRKLVDSLIVHSIMANATGVLDTIISVFRVQHLMNKVHKKEITSAEEVNKILSSAIVLPSEIFPLEFEPPKTKFELPDIGKKEDNNAAINEEIKKITETQKAITELHDKKIISTLTNFPTFKEIKNAVSDSDTAKAGDTKSTKQAEDNALYHFNKLAEQKRKTSLTNDDIKKLGADAKDVLTGVGIEQQEIIDIPLVVQTLNRKIYDLSNALTYTHGFTLEQFYQGLAFRFDPSTVDENCLKPKTDFTYCQLLAKLRFEQPSKPFVHVLGSGPIKL